MAAIAKPGTRSDPKLTNPGDIAIVQGRDSRTGRIGGQAEKQEAERAAWSAPGVTKVENDITISP